MGLSSAPMSTWDMMEDLRVLALSSSTVPTTLGMRFSNSTDMTGKEECSRSEKTDSPAPTWLAMAVLPAVGLVAGVEDSAAGLVAGVSLAGVVVSMEAVFVADLAAVLVVVLMPAPHPSRLILSPTTLHLVLTRARSSMFAM